MRIKLPNRHYGQDIDVDLLVRILGGTLEFAAMNGSQWPEMAQAVDGGLASWQERAA